MKEDYFCNMGFPSRGFKCCRKRGHSSPISICFAIKEGKGYWLFQDGIAYEPNFNNWPKDVQQLFDPISWADVK